MTPEEKNDTGGWGRWGKHVLIELDRSHEERKELFQRMNEVESRVAVLVAKAALMGSLGGAALSIVVSVINWLITR